MILALGLLSILFFAGCELPSSSGKSRHDFGENDPNVVLCMGDSITHGYTLPRDQNYPSQLAVFLGRRVINTGLIGATSRDGLRRIRGLLEENKPGYVLIMYGTNDVRTGSTGATIDNLRQMIRIAKEQNVIPIIATLPPTSGRYAFMLEDLVAMNSRIRSLASSEGVRVADVARAFDSNVSLLQDGIHPNRDGMQKIALAFFDRID